MKGERKLKRAELLLLAPFVMVVIIALISYSRESARKQYGYEIVGKWLSLRNGLVQEIRKDGTASWVEEDGTKVMRIYEFIDDNHIRVRGADLPAGVAFIYKIEINGDTLTMDLEGYTGKEPVRSTLRRIH